MTSVHKRDRKEYAYCVTTRLTCLNMLRLSQVWLANGVASILISQVLQANSEELVFIFSSLLQLLTSSSPADTFSVSSVCDTYLIFFRPEQIF